MPAASLLDYLPAFEMGAKVLIGVFLFVLGFIGVLFFILKGYLGTIQRGQKQLFDTMNAHEASIQTLEMVGLMTNPDKTMVQRALMPNRRDLAAKKEEEG